MGIWTRQNTDRAGGIRPPRTPAEQRRRRRRRIATSGVAAVLVVAGAVVGWRLLSGGDCGDGVVRRGSDCDGVTDGSYVFEPQLRDVEGRIKAENDRVTDRPHVTVALMLTLTTADDGLVPIKRIRAQVEGAYVAQHIANENGANPRIRLVLANTGSREQSWPEVARKVLGMVGEPDNLVAVVGPGLSTTATAQSLKLITGNRVPVVGNQITADVLNATGADVGGPFHGLVKVNVNVADELSVLAEYLHQHRPDLATAMLVSDSNPDDLYTRSLQADFTHGPLASYWVAGGRVVQPYDGSPGAPGTNQQFRAIVGNLCGENSPDMVFYAGRALLLPDFVQGLRERTCARTRTITVVTGSDASALTDTLPPAGDNDAPVSVIYTPLAAPDPLADPKWNPEVAQYRRFQDAFTRDNHFDPRDLSDGWAIMTYDAVLATTIAVERATGQSRRIPTPEDVASLLRLLNSASNSVPGAAGTFTFDPTDGDVRGRQMHVLELRPDGTLGVLARYQQPVDVHGGR